MGYWRIPIGGSGCVLMGCTSTPKGTASCTNASASGLPFCNGAIRV